MSDQSPNAATPGQKIVVDGASKAYDSVQALSDVSLSVREGEFCCIVGPSGCGKTTLLRTIAGLEDADRGSIRSNSHNCLADNQGCVESFVVEAPCAEVLRFIGTVRGADEAGSVEYTAVSVNLIHEDISES